MSKYRPWKFAFYQYNSIPIMNDPDILFSRHRSTFRTFVYSMFFITLYVTMIDILAYVYSSPRKFLFNIQIQTVKNNNVNFIDNVHFNVSIFVNSYYTQEIFDFNLCANVFLISHMPMLQDTSYYKLPNRINRNVTYKY